MTVRVNGHFGEWLQGRVGDTIALVTVTCPLLHVQAERVTEGSFALDDADNLIGGERAHKFLRAVGGRDGHYRVTGNIPPGTGAGASTAALVALSRAASGREGRLAAACVETEGASDPLMLPSPDQVLWAPREGRSLAKLPPLPSAEIIGGFWGSPLRTDPDDTSFPEVDDLAASLRTPCSLEQLAEVATESLRRTTGLRGPSDDPTLDLYDALGAVGCMRAHTGSARGLIFASGTAPANAFAALSEAGFSHPIQFTTGGIP